MNCAHDRDPEKCDQCRIEGLTTSALLEEVETYASALRDNGLIARGWWVELARRLRKSRSREMVG